MADIIKFQCDKCGACCRAAECKYLTTENKCSVYEDRPMICRVDKMYDLFSGDKLSKEGYYKFYKKFCEFLRKNTNNHRG